MESLTNFRNNLGKVSLINNLSTFRVNDVTIKISFPTLADTVNELDFATFSTILGLGLKDIEDPSAFNLKASSDTELCLGLTLSSQYSDVMQYFLKKYIKDVEFINKKMMVNEQRITSKEFEFIRDALLISLNKVELPDLEKINKEKSELDAATGIEKKMLLRQIEVNKKVERAKAKKKDKDNESMDLDKIIMILLFEFKQLSLEDIMKMNFFTITWYFSFVGAIDAHYVHRVAAGNGLLKKYQYFLK